MAYELHKSGLFWVNTQSRFDKREKILRLRHGTKGVKVFWRLVEEFFKIRPNRIPYTIGKGILKDITIELKYTDEFMKDVIWFCDLNYKMIKTAGDFLEIDYNAHGLYAEYIENYPVPFIEERPKRMSFDDKLPTSIRPVSYFKWYKIKFEVWKRDNYTCTYCKKTSNSLVVDHIIPLSRGGNSLMGNLTTCCNKCNLQKRNRTPKEFEKWKQKHNRRANLCVVR